MRRQVFVIPAAILYIVGGVCLVTVFNHSSDQIAEKSETIKKVRKNTAQEHQGKDKELAEADQSKGQSDPSEFPKVSLPQTNIATTDTDTKSTTTKVSETNHTANDITKPDQLIPQDTMDHLAEEQAQQNNIGKKYMLSVAPQVQRAWNTCAPTTVSMMLSSRGVTVSQETLASEMGTDTTFGTHNSNAIRVLNRYLFGYDIPQAHQAGYRLATVTTADPNSEQMKLFKERLKQNIADGYPMYYTFDNAKIYPGSSGEHNVIGIGYQTNADESDIAYLYYLDPYYVQQDSTYGGLKKITPEELFQGMLTCLEPNYAW